jgi:hypothetical protein
MKCRDALREFIAGRGISVVLLRDPPPQAFCTLVFGRPNED